MVVMVFFNLFYFACGCPHPHPPPPPPPPAPPQFLGCCAFSGLLLSIRQCRGGVSLAAALLWRA